jgi:hypothetical protein
MVVQMRYPKKYIDTPECLDPESFSINIPVVGKQDLPTRIEERVPRNQPCPTELLNLVSQVGP